MNANQALLQVQNLALNIGSTPILRDISFALNPGEILALTGPNGAGKSSLLKCLSGDFNPDSGNIFFKQREMKEWQPHDLATERAVLPQLNLLNFPYSVEEVVALGRTPHSSGIATDKAIVNELMTELDLHYLIGRSYTQLSGGEKQRTQLARVFAQIWHSHKEPGAPHSGKLLLLDEPVNALDLGHQQQLMSLLKNLIKQHISIVIVLHDLNLASRFADKVVLMRCGEIAAQGNPENVFTNEILQEVFSADIQVIKHPDTNKPLILA